MIKKTKWINLECSKNTPKLIAFFCDKLTNRQTDKQIKTKYFNIENIKKKQKGNMNVNIMMKY